MTDGSDINSVNSNLPAEPTVSLTPPPLPPTDDPITSAPVVPQKEEVRPSFSAMPDNDFSPANPLNAPIDVSAPISQNFPEKMEPVVDPMAMQPPTIELPNVPVIDPVMPVTVEEKFVPPPLPQMPQKEETTSVNLAGDATPPPPPKTGLGAKPFVIGGVLFFMAISAGIAFYFIQRGGLGFQKKAAGESCTYGETCQVGDKTGTRSCTGTKNENNVCVYDPAVAPNCSACGYCGDGACGGGEGADNCPADCGGTSPTVVPGTDPCSPNKGCPGGTQDCKSLQAPSGQRYQCIKDESKPQCPNSCKLFADGEPAGCCSSNADCASWETCESGNGACKSGSSCRSQAGCKIDSDCANGEKCYNGTCTYTPGEGSNLQCSANGGGVFIANQTGQDITGVTIEWFSKKCGGNSCACSGSPTTEYNQTIKNGGDWGRKISGEGCSWQSDVKIIGGTGILAGCNNANSGCTMEGVCGGQPTTPPGIPVCASVDAYKVGTTPPSLAGLLPGDILRITVSASSAVDGAAIKIKKGTVEQLFNSIDGQGLWTTQGRVWQYDYTVPADGLGDWEVSGFVKTGGIWK